MVLLAELVSAGRKQRDYLEEAANTVEKIGKVAGGFTSVIEFTKKVVGLIQANL